MSKSSIRKHQSLEKQVLQNVDIALAVSPSWALDLKRLGAKCVEVITNGYDPDDFELMPKKNDKFVIGHYGLLNHLRNPINLWKALDVLCEENIDFSSKLEIHLSGNIDREIISEIESFSNLSTKIKELGYLSHSDLLKRYYQTDVLLLLLFNSKSGIGNYPGKIFEYFAVKRTILAFGPDNSDAQDLIKETNSGLYFSYKEEDIKEDILGLYKARGFTRINNVDNFSRDKLASRLSDLLYNI